MDFRNDVNKIMKNVQVDYEITEEILNNTTRKRKRSFAPKRVVVVAMAAVLCIGTMAVSVSGITGVWNDIVEKVANKNIEVDQQEQIKLMKNGYVYTADMDKVTASSKGITVSLVQTVADKKGIYVYLKVKSEKFKIKESMGFVNVKINLEGTGEIVKEISDITPISDYEGVMEIYGSIEAYGAKEGLDIDGNKIEVILTDLHDGIGKIDTDGININDTNGIRIVNRSFNTLADSEWKISWIGKSNSDSKIVRMSETIDVDGKQAKIESFEITPLSVHIKFDYPEKEGYDWFEIPFAIIMKDGTKHEYDKHGFEGIFRDDYQGTDETFIRIKKPIDINNIDYIEVCGTRYDIN